MSSRNISQREARATRKELADLKARRRIEVENWSNEWPDGVHLFTGSKGDTLDAGDIAIVRTARALGHPVVVTASGDGLHFYGIKNR